MRPAHADYIFGKHASFKVEIPIFALWPRTKQQVYFKLSLNGS